MLKINEVPLCPSGRILPLSKKEQGKVEQHCIQLEPENVGIDLKMSVEDARKLFDDDHLKALQSLLHEFFGYHSKINSNFSWIEKEIQNEHEQQKNFKW